MGYPEDETPGEKLIRRSKETPLVPVGFAMALGTCAYAAYNINNRKGKVSIYLMQLRVTAQGMVVGGLFLTAGYQLYQKLSSKD